MEDEKKWSKKFDRCVKCGGTDVKHVARGLCLWCYHYEAYLKDRSGGGGEYGAAARKLNYQYLHEEYVKKKRSLADIAKESKCTRAYVYRRMKEFNVPLRTKTEAREIVYEQKKMVVKRVDENGTERLVTHREIKIYEGFFSSWSKEMAYVLGVIYTDGNVFHERKRNIYRLSVSQKEPELLNKILKLMNCDASLYHHARREYTSGIAGELYWFNIPNEKVYKDLMKLGVTQNKSKTIRFPDIPPEYVRHFFRGCWDGDGSVYIETKSGGIRASFITGSLTFLESLIRELKMAGLSERKIYKTKSKEPSYYIKFMREDDCRKLYHYFYEGVEPKQYLERKYRVFEKYFGSLDKSLEGSEKIPQYSDGPKEIKQPLPF